LSIENQSVMQVLDSQYVISDWLSIG